MIVMQEHGHLTSSTQFEGSVILEGRFGFALTEPQAAKISWLTRDDGSWEIRFLSAHRLLVPHGATGGVWLRFDGDNGYPLIRQPQGAPGEVVILPQHAHEE